MARKKKQGVTDGNLPYTKRLRKEREEREFWNSFGEIQSHYNHVDFRCSSVTDEQLHLLVTRVRSVNMFDLNETEVTCHGLEALTKLDFLYELRLKECQGIDNDCIPIINKIGSLKLLYVKATPITLDGLLGLGNLVNLEELFFSGTQVENMEEKLDQLAKLLPNCQLIMDGKDVPRKGRDFDMKF